MKKTIGYAEVLQITLENVQALESETMPLRECVARVTAKDLYAKVDSPSGNASLKDGFALCSRDIDDASPGNPVRLKIIDTAFAVVSDDDLTVDVPLFEINDYFGICNLIEERYLSESKEVL
jgi:molybdopterin molybdotransferase